MRSGHHVAPSLTALALAGGLALAAPGQAHACSCRDLFVTAPAKGETRVPLDTKLWHVEGYAQPGRYRLTGPEGEVPLATLPLGTVSYTVGRLSTPERELTAGAAYVFSFCPDNGTCRELSRFITGMEGTPPRAS